MYGLGLPIVGPYDRDFLAGVLSGFVLVVEIKGKFSIRAVQDEFARIFYAQKSAIFRRFYAFLGHRLVVRTLARTFTVHNFAGIRQGSIILLLARHRSCPQKCCSE